MSPPNTLHYITLHQIKWVNVPILYITLYHITSDKMGKFPPWCWAQSVQACQYTSLVCRLTTRCITKYNQYDIQCTYIWYKILSTSFSRARKSLRVAKSSKKSDTKRPFRSAETDPHIWNEYAHNVLYGVVHIDLQQCLSRLVYYIVYSKGLLKGPSLTTVGLSRLNFGHNQST